MIEARIPQIFSLLLLHPPLYNTLLLFTFADYFCIPSKQEHSIELIHTGAFNRFFNESTWIKCMNYKIIQFRANVKSQDQRQFHQLISTYFWTNSTPIIKLNHGITRTQYILEQHNRSYPALVLSIEHTRCSDKCSLYTLRLGSFITVWSSLITAMVVLFAFDTTHPPLCPLYRITRLCSLMGWNLMENWSIRPDSLSI